MSQQEQKPRVETEQVEEEGGVSSDFEVLGFLEESHHIADLGLPPSLTRASVTRSVSETLLSHDTGLFDEEDVYRSVASVRQVSEFSEPSFANELETGFSCNNDFGVVSNQVADIGILTRSLSEHFCTPIHAFCSMEGSLLVKRIESAFKSCCIDFRPFDSFTSSFAAKKDGVRFDVYILELQEEDQVEYGTYIIELQRLSCVMPSVWPVLSAAFMEQMRDICTDQGFFESSFESRASSPMLQHMLVGDEMDDDEDMYDVSDEQLVKEYERIVQMLCAPTTSYENKLQLCAVLVQFSQESAGQEILLRVQAMEPLLRLLQTELLHGCVSGDLNTGLCTVVANIACGARESTDLGACVAMEVLKNGSGDRLEVEQLRSAAKALAVFVKRIQKADLKPVIKEAVLQRCAVCSDTVFTEHSNAILRSLAVPV